MRFFNAVLATLLFAQPQLATALDPNSLLSQYAHRSWRVLDGTLSAAPFALAQTSDGYLWIGSERGLLRFDGVRFVDWNPPAEHKLALKVFQLAATSDGSLWIGTDIGLFRWRDGTFKRIGTLTAAVFSLLVAPDQTVWLTLTDITPQHICRVVNDDLDCNATPGVSLRHANCCAQMLAARADGSIWVGSDESLFRWSPAATLTYRPAAAAEIRNMSGVSGFVIDRSGEQWVGIAAKGREGGLQRLREGRFSPLKTAGIDTSNWIVSTLFVDRDDVLWVGTPAGLYRVARSRIDWMGESSGLTGDNILRILEDHEGNVWVATAKGLDQFRNLKVTTVGDDVDGVLARRDGSLWASTATGLRVHRDGTWQRIDQSDGLPGSQTTSLFEDRAGGLWVGVEQGLTLYESGRFKSIDGLDGRAIGMVVGMTEDRAGALWVAVTGDQRKILQIVDGKVRRELLPPAFPAARRLAAAPDGSVWFGLLDGNLARFFAGELAVFPVERDPSVPDSLLVNMIEQIEVSEDGAVRAASASGYIESRNGRQVRMSGANGLPCTGVLSFLYDQTEDLWLYMSCGLARIPHSEVAAWRSNAAHRLRFDFFDTLDGAHPTWAAFSPGAVRTGDGRLWFANSLALQTIDPAAIHRNEVVPPLRIEALVADRRDHALALPIRLPALTRDVRIDYSAMSFSIPQKVLFRYRLEGYENDWQEAGTRREAFFSNLPPGQYRFHVTACNEDHVCNTNGDRLSFTLLPAFYQTGWFLALCTAVAVALLSLVFSWRLSYLTSRLRARLEERIDERERIARELHDTFLQSIQGLILKFQSIMETIPSDQPAHRGMAEALDRADRVLREGRQRVSDLRQSAGSRTDLEQELRDLAGTLIRNDLPKVRVEVDGNARPLHPVVCDEIQGIVREAVTNTVRHANASSIHIEIVYSRPALIVRVSDDGIGFDAAAKAGANPGRFGLVGMCERADKIQAQLDISSGQGAGTVVQITVPARIAFRRARNGRSRP
ncbi:MAG TPA: two-component regulator propeller domain-containing protein [Steroidobacter sp.]|uniref:sensor histidine kinase n=1 Tax=Steroidobacter sp. TaxID=1978227 RepID=UPI002ED7E18D